eukprot:41333-Eustigmatos_ZCMA.PRE.1
MQRGAIELRVGRPPSTARKRKASQLMSTMVGPEEGCDGPSGMLVREVAELLRLGTEGGAPGVTDILQPWHREGMCAELRDVVDGCHVQLC